MSSGLNAAQSEAVHYVDGPCLVLAGAGSGKTRVITSKIAHLVNHHGYSAKHIIAVTFTNKAASEMRERAAKLLQKHEAKGLWVSTFHSLGLQLMRSECAALGLKERFSIFDSADVFGLLQQLMSSTDKKEIGQARNTISLWKNALKSADDALAQAKNDAEAMLARIYQNYEATLRAYQAVDFDDLILRPTRLLAENAEIRKKWQNHFRHILVDEVQDTNACQYDMLRLLAGPRAMFTAVGDDDQAIYAWRGATLENLKQLTHDYPQLKVVKLEQNYRSTLRILSAANRLIENNPKLFAKTLWSTLGAGEPIQVLSMKDEEHEAEQLALMLSNHRFERRAQWSDYAVLYRNNFQARVLEQALRQFKIPYLISGGQSFFDKAEIKDLTAYLRLLVNDDDDPAFIRAITTPKRGIGQKTLEALGAYAASRGVSLFEALFETGVEGRLPGAQLEALRMFGSFINGIAYRAPHESAKDLLNELLKAIGYEEWLYQQHDERMAQSKWKTILDFVEWMGNKADEDGQNLIELTQKVALITLLEKQQGDAKPDAVQLSTLHAAKGLEYPHVFLMGCEESLLPSFGDEEARLLTPERLEEERRLMYVGVTRAQRSLTLTWCKQRKKGRDYVPQHISRFVEELKLQTDDALPIEHTNMSPKDRFSALRGLLGKGGVEPTN